jgi:hypothetical protein
MHRRRFLAAAAGLVCLGAASDEPPILEGALRRGTPVRGAGFEGAIFDASEARLVRPFVDGDVAGFWTPTESVVAEFEAALAGALARARAAPESLRPTQTQRADLSSLPGQIDEILRDLAAYRRQYFGVVGQNALNRLFVNFFRKDLEDDLDWTTRYVYAPAGGTGYWRIQYEVATARFMQFNINAAT